MWRRLSFIFFLAFRPLFRGDRWSLVLTIAIMMMVFVNLLFTDAIFSGITKAMNDNRINYQFGELIIEPAPGEDFVTHRLALLSFLRGLPAVVQAGDYLQTGAFFINRKAGDGRDEAKVASNLLGVDPADPPFPYQDNVLVGRFLEPSDRLGIVLGKGLAGGYSSSVYPSDLDHAQVGDEIDVVVNGVTYRLTVVGILDTKNFDIDFYAFIPKETLRRMLGVSDHEASAVVVRTQTPEDAFAVKERLFRQPLFANYEIADWKEKLAFGASISESFEVIGAILRVIGALLAGLVVFIVIFVDIVNRRRQLGIFKAIGIADWVIIAAYVLRGLFYAAFGALFGLLFMLVVVWWFTAHPIAMPMADVVPLLKPKALWASFWFFLAAGVVGSLLPAYREIRKRVLLLLYH